jgi:hypothetical protein
MLMITSGVVLLLASAAFVVWDFYRFRADMQADLVTEAQLVLDNTEAAITFNDPDAAAETLEMLEIHPHTQLACLYLPSGKVFRVAKLQGSDRHLPGNRDGGRRADHERPHVRDRATRRVAATRVRCC